MLENFKQQMDFSLNKRGAKFPTINYESVFK